MVASIQVEVHPLWRNDDLIEFCGSEGIHVSAYCPLGTPWTSAKAVIRRADPASQHPVIQSIAKKYSKHALHIIMRWGLQHGTSILAKSSNPQRIKVWAPHRSPLLFYYFHHLVWQSSPKLALAEHIIFSANVSTIGRQVISASGTPAQSSAKPHRKRARQYTRQRSPGSQACLEDSSAQDLEVIRQAMICAG